MIGPKEQLQKTLDDLTVALQNNNARIDAMEDVIDELIKEGKDLEISIKAYTACIAKFDDITKPVDPAPAPNAPEPDPATPAPAPI